YVAGRRIERVVKASNRTAAKKLAQSMREELVNRASTSTLALDPRLTVETLYDEWIDARKAQVARGERARRSVELTEQRWRDHIKAKLEGVRLAEVSKRDVIAVLTAARKKKLSSSTQDGLLDIMSGLFRYAVETDRLAVNPARSLPKEVRPTSKKDK